MANLQAASAVRYQPAERPLLATAFASPAITVRAPSLSQPVSALPPPTTYLVLVPPPTLALTGRDKIAYRDDLLAVAGPAATQGPPQSRCQDVGLSTRPYLPALGRRPFGRQRSTTITARSGRCAGRGAEGRKQRAEVMMRLMAASAFLPLATSPLPPVPTSTPGPSASSVQVLVPPTTTAEVALNDQHRIIIIPPPPVHLERLSHQPFTLPGTRCGSLRWTTACKVGNFSRYAAFLLSVFTTVAERLPQITDIPAVSYTPAAPSPSPPNDSLLCVCPTPSYYGRVFT